MLSAIPRFSSTLIALRALPKAMQRSAQPAYAIDRVEFNLTDGKTDVFVQHHNVAGQQVGQTVKVADSLVGTSKNLLQGLVGGQQRLSLELLPNKVLSQLHGTLIPHTRTNPGFRAYVAEKQSGVPTQLSPLVMGGDQYRLGFDYQPVKAEGKKVFQVTAMTLYFPNQWGQIPYAELSKARRD